jgi:TRAP-type mannitol/chloroaromatic compound transport system substrate-binding protein
MLDEYTARNNQALVELVEVHKVDVRKLPDEVLTELQALSKQVQQEMAAENAFAKRVSDSIEAFKKQATAYHGISEEAYYQARQQK